MAIRRSSTFKRIGDIPQTPTAGTPPPPVQGIPQPNAPVLYPEQYVDPVVPQATERIGSGVGKGFSSPVERIAPRIDVSNEQRASTPLPVDYDALIANDPEYQMLLAKLEAAMKNAESDAGAESANVQAQTLRRLQMLKEQGELGLTRSVEDFSGRGLGFSGALLENQGKIRRQVADEEVNTRTDEAGRLADITRQLGRARNDTEVNKAEGLMSTSAKVRGQEHAPIFARQSGFGTIKAAAQREAPTIIDPAAVARRVGAPGADSPTTGAGGVLGGRQRRRR